MRKFFSFLFGLSVLALSAPVGAQSQAHVDLYAPDVSAFPKISALLDVYDSNNIFASGLKPEAVTVYEDGQPLPADELTEMMVPLQLVVAINPGPALDARDSQGLSKYQRLVQVISGWAQTQQNNSDDMSLVSLSGSIISHAPLKDFIVSLNAFQPDFRASTPNLQSLAIALDTASAQTPQAGMKRAVLFVTQHMDDATIANEIQPYIQKAQENNIRVYVWFVDLDAYFVTNSAAAFNALALQTGGSFFAYSGEEQFPDLESYFAYLRRVYAFTYTSSLKQGGAHTISVNANVTGTTAISAQGRFEIDIQPPNPILVNPPLQIVRQAPPEDPFNVEMILPTQQELEVIVDFPDGHKRPITRLALYVDGIVVAEHKEAPFEKFTWDLSEYKLSGQHTIAVEATDSLGLTKVSMGIPVTVTVIQPPTGMRALLAKYRQPFTVGVISLAGIVLLGFILLSGRFKLPNLGQRREERRVMEDPLMQPITPEVVEQPAVKEKKRKKSIVNGTSAGDKKSVTEAPAYLIRLQPDGKPAAANPIALMGAEIIFGTDPTQAQYILDDLSVASIHARLKHNEAGQFVLYDAGSIAGTWVNYDSITREGQQLTHGDVVHFGQLAYRFQLHTPSDGVEPTITFETIAK